MLALFVGLILFIGYAVMFLALALQYRITRAAQRHNRELRDRIVKQAGHMSKLERINECQRQALIAKGGLVESWPEYIDR